MERIWKWTALVSVGLVVLCISPLLLYLLFGPEDGNPVGLGFLMVFGTPVFSATGALGLIMWLSARSVKRKDNG